MNGTCVKRHCRYKFSRAHVIMPFRKRVQRGRTTNTSSNMQNNKLQRSVHQNGKLQIEDVTSKDIADDPYIDFKTHAEYLKNSEQIRMYSNVIRGNSHLFRGKVCCLHYSLGEFIECNQYKLFACRLS